MDAAGSLTDSEELRISQQIVRADGEDNNALTFIKMIFAAGNERCFGQACLHFTCSNILQNVGMLSEKDWATHTKVFAHSCNMRVSVANAGAS